jgi:alkylation response protein AidB-like acyl-CoA dehydrogenase
MAATEITSEHEDFRDSVATFIARNVVPHHERWRDEGGVDRELWREAGRHDFLGFAVPVELGGSGIDDYRFNAILIEALAREGLALASSIGMHTDVVAPYLLELTDQEQRERWLPRFCSGELITAIGMTEPGAGSDLAALQTRAVPTDSGWEMTGSKTFITNGARADLVVTAARTGEGRHDISLFAVEADSPGFSRGRKLDKIGQPEVDTAELFFEGVALGPEHLLGELNRGFVHMMERLPQERIHSAVINTAHAEAALAETLVYVKERQAFGKPIGAFQHNLFLLAELVTELEVTRCYVDSCLADHIAGRCTPVQAAKAKWWSAEVQNKVIDACVQLFGGYGYMREYAVGRAWADARVTKIWAGSNEIMKEIIGRDLGLAAR